MATTYILNTHAISFTAGAGKFGEFEPHRQLVSVCWLGYDQTR